MESHPYQLSATSAMVLLWAKEEIYQTGYAKQYLDTVDLEAGHPLRLECEKAWDHCHEILRNRKHTIFKLIESNLNKTHQLVILASGLDPLALKVLDINSKTKIFEIDVCNMDVKQNIYDSILPQDLSDQITLISSDITSKDVHKKLKQANYDNTIPTIIIAEGITYYVSNNFLWKTMANFQTKSHHNMVVMDYLIPPSQMNTNNATIMTQIFGLLSTKLELDLITLLDYESISSQVNQLNGTMKTRFKMCDMELDRIGKNHFFDAQSYPGQISGVEVCHFNI